MGDEKRTRLVFLGFDDADEAESALATLEEDIKDKDIAVDDWAIIHKEPGGEISIRSDKKVDPGAGHGAKVGGTAGAILAVLAGPGGIGAVVGGAAIGAVASAVRDTGFKNKDIDEVSRLMADGRSGIMIAVPLAGSERFDEYATTSRLYARSERHHQADVVPGRDFQQALADYRAHEED